MGFVNEGPYANFENVPYIDEYYSKVFGITTIVNGNIAYLKNIITNKINTIIAYGKSTQNGTPTPEAPVAIKSVDELALNAAGRNIYHETEHNIGSTWTSARVTVTKSECNRYIISGTSNGTHWLWGGGGSLDNRLFTFLPAGTYTASLGGDGKSMCQIAVKGKEGNNQTDIAGGASPLTFTLEKATPVKVAIYTKVNKTFSNTEVTLQLELGSTATEYEPYVGTSTPIDLQGYQLRSLPDGTRDELSVDSAGNVTLTRRVTTEIIDGTETNWRKSDSYPGGYFISNWASDRGVAGSANHMQDRFVTATWTGTYAVGTCLFDGSLNFLLDNSLYPTLSDFKTWLNENPVTVQYPLATPVTHNLGTVKLPNFLKYTTVWFATAELSVSYQQSLADINSEFISHNSFTNFINALAEFLKTNIVENWNSANNCYEYAIGADALTAFNNVNTNMAEITKIQPIEDLQPIDDIQPISPIEIGYNEISAENDSPMLS